MARERRMPLRLLIAAVWLGAALALGSCGGGVGSGGTGAPVQASGSGIVTGFGSVYIDGARYDDRDAVIETEVAPGVYANAALALGQSVEVGMVDEGVAATIAVEPRLVGPVEAVDGGALRVLGQTVSLNADPALGPVTLLPGGMPRAGDWAEVHGFARADGTLQATRVERVARPPAQWRAAGRVSGLRADGSSFVLGQLTVEAGDAALQPRGAVLADGEPVVVFGERAGTRLRATRIRIVERISTEALDAQIGGRVEELAGAVFSLGGVRVEAGAAEVRPAGEALADGRYVRVRGRYRAPDVLVAERIDIRGGGAAAVTPVELAGTLFDVDTAAGTARLRDTTVFTAAARLQGCAGGLAAGVYVELSGRIDDGRVVAETIGCRADEPRDATVERRGIAGALQRGGDNGDAGSDDDGSGGRGKGRDERPQPGRFLLAPLGGGTPIEVRVGRRTMLDGVDLAALDGQRVRVEGRFRGNVLVARVVEALP